MMRGKSEWNMACTRYFYVKIPKSGELQPLEKFVENIKSKKPNLIFDHEMMKKYEYKYRNEEYKYDNLILSQILELELPAFYNIRDEFFGCSSLKSGYCLRLLQTLDRYIMKARFETIKSATILDIDFLNSDYSKKNYQWQYFQRCYYAENAIYSYYAAFEIILQLIWISKEYYKEKKDYMSKQTFYNAVKDCTLGKLITKLKDEDLSLLRKFLCLSDKKPSYTLLDDFKCVRDWCNGFKHHGILRFDGEKEADKPTISFVPTQNSEFFNLEGFSSDDFQYEYLDLDLDVLPQLVKYHSAIMNLARNVIDSCYIRET